MDQGNGLQSEGWCQGLNPVKPYARGSCVGPRRVSPDGMVEGDEDMVVEEVGQDKLDYEAQRKGVDQPKMVAAKSLPMVTREKLQKGLEQRSRYKRKVDMAIWLGRMHMGRRFLVLAAFMWLFQRQWERLWEGRREFAGSRLYRKSSRQWKMLKSGDRRCMLIKERK